MFMVFELIRICTERFYLFYEILHFLRISLLITGVNIILLNLQKLMKIKLQTMFLLTYIHRTVFTYEIPTLLI